METFSALLAICAGNSPVPGEFPTQRPVTRSFDVYFDLRPNKLLSKHSWGWWYDTLSWSLWRHCNELHNILCVGVCQWYKSMTQALPSMSVWINYHYLKSGPGWVCVNVITYPYLNALNSWLFSCKLLIIHRHQQPLVVPCMCFIAFIVICNGWQGVLNGHYSGFSRAVTFTRERHYYVIMLLVSRRSWYTKKQKQRALSDSV